MKLILSGYSGSKQILRASSYLVRKYLGETFEVIWLNYGQPPDGVIFGYYVPLADKQESVQSWASDIRNFLTGLTDELVIFTLDDYLLSEALNEPRYQDMLKRIQADSAVVCARLCVSDFYLPKEVARTDGEVIELSVKAEYSSTAQYCIWRRDFLIDLLKQKQVKTPWEFEVLGSRWLNTTGRKVIGHKTAPALLYNHASSLSSRWRGINIDGCVDSDIEDLITAGLLNRSELTHRGETVIWGTPPKHLSDPRIQDSQKESL